MCIGIDSGCRNYIRFSMYAAVQPDSFASDSLYQHGCCYEQMQGRL